MTNSAGKLCFINTSLNTLNGFQWCMSKEGNNSAFVSYWQSTELNLHYKSHTKNLNVPAIELHITKWLCMSSASLQGRTINVNDYTFLSSQKDIII